MTNQNAFSVKEFCRRNGIGLTKAYEEIRAGRLRAKKAGCRTLILAEDEAEWLKSLPDRLEWKPS